MNKKCPTCGKEMNDKEYIDYLEKKVKELELKQKFVWNPPNNNWPPNVFVKPFITNCENCGMYTNEANQCLSCGKQY